MSRRKETGGELKTEERRERSERHNQRGG